MEKTIYDLEFHETIEIKSGYISYTVTRVAGGWIYNYIRLDRNQITMVFVPFDNQFQKVKNGINN